MLAEREIKVEIEDDWLREMDIKAEVDDGYSTDREIKMEVENEMTGSREAVIQIEDEIGEFIQVKEIKKEVANEVEDAGVTTIEVGARYMRKYGCDSVMATRLAFNSSEVENEWIKTTDPEVLRLRKWVAEFKKNQEEEEEKKAKSPPKPKTKKGIAKKAQKTKAKAPQKKPKFVCPSCEKESKSGTCFCNGCGEWYHLRCVKIKSREWTPKFRCPDCLDDN